MFQVSSKYSLDISDLVENYKTAANIHEKLGESAKQLNSTSRLSGLVQQQQQSNQNLGQQVVLYQRVQAAQVSLFREAARYEGELRNIKARQAELAKGNEYDELTKEVQRLNLELEKLKKLQNDTSSGGGQGRDGGGRFTGKGGGFLGELQGSAGKLTAFIGVSFGAAEALRLMLTETAKFGKGLSELSAITGTTGKDLAFLANAALDLEQKTGIAGSEVVEAFKLIGSIRPELLSNKEALASVTTEVIALAQASGVTLPDAATAAIGALNQFNENSDQAARFVNVLAAGAKEGASEVKDTTEALKNSGTAMKAAGLSFEQGNALIQILAKGMIKGSEAGTALRNILIKLETDTDKNLRPSIVGLDKALENAAKKYDTTTAQAKRFGDENFIAAAQVLAARKEVTSMTEALTGTDTAYEQQRTNLDNLATDLERSGVAIKGFFRNLGLSQEGFLRDIVRGFNSAVNDITAKKSVLQAFFQEVFSFQNLQYPGQNILRGLSAANDVRKDNLTTARQQADVAGVKSSAVKGVAEETKQLAELYKEQGEKVPDAQRKAINKVAALRDQELKEAKAAHERLKSEAVAAGRYEQGASKALIDSYSKQFDTSQRRLTAAKAAKDKADAEAKRQAKSDLDQAEALKKLKNEPESAEAKKAREKAQKIEEESNKLLLKAREDYVKEYEKVEEAFNKAKLEALKGDEQKYIAEKAKLDRAELDAEERHLTAMLQLAASTKTGKDQKTGQRFVIADTTIQLPKDVRDEYARQREDIDKEADRKINIARIRQEVALLDLQEDSEAKQLAQFEKYWEEKILIDTKKGVKLADLEKKRDADQLALIIDQDKRKIKAIQDIATTNIQRREKGNQTFGAFERTNALDQTYTDEFAAASELRGLRSKPDPDGKNNPEIVQLELLLKKIKDKRKEIELLGPINKDIWDLLGISKSFKDDTERTIFLNSVDMVSEAIRSATELAIQSSQQRIDLLDKEIQEKQDAIKIEEDRNKEGYANNLLLRQAELEDLKRQKAEEQAIQKRALETQQLLDTASIVSNNAVTVSNLIGSAAKAFDKSLSSTFNPVLGVILAIGAIATIFATFTAVKAKAQAITQLREGGLIKFGRLHEQGGHRIEGTDIEVEGGEFVNKRSMSAKHGQALEAINRDDAQAAIMALVTSGRLGLPNFILRYMNGPAVGVPTPQKDTGADQVLYLKSMDQRLSKIERNTQKGKDRVGLGDGSYLEFDGDNKQLKRP